MKKKSDVKTLLFYIKRVFNFVLDFIWPQFCLGCGREGSIACGFCLNDIIIEDNQKINWPKDSQFYFKACYRGCDYHNNLIQKLIKHYKYSYLENIGNLLVDILEKQARRLNLKQNTIIVNIPLHKAKKRKRGFDQTEILAKQLAKRLALPYLPLLIRNKNNQAQAKLDKKSRQKNVLGIFIINEKAVLRQALLESDHSALSSWPKGRPRSRRQDDSNILLIDDVTTTGSTLNQAAKTLYKYGFKNISCLVLAKN